MYVCFIVLHLMGIYVGVCGVGIIYLLLLLLLLPPSSFFTAQYSESLPSIPFHTLSQQIFIFPSLHDPPPPPLPPIPPPIPIPIPEPEPPFFFPFSFSLSFPFLPPPPPRAGLPTPLPVPASSSSRRTRWCGGTSYSSRQRVCGVGDGYESGRRWEYGWVRVESGGKAWWDWVVVGGLEGLDGEGEEGERPRTRLVKWVRVCWRDCVVGYMLG
ncbi:hypothetical protein P280DRAFT_152825 [Massarina eburnea CBS 473.64]|uniref:Uncharacterized protein n=1 Tax=Massarina eburnea CBS 473.64 TaxID=1395130 RepID=A0A6A6RPK5_9PLEO|nr:hypothetical protein P280DRAFT_152825 [Massarina eburnea CBS 473.64]